LKKYLAYAKKITPSLSEEATEHISMTWSELRQKVLANE
jgi:DNA replicative helicase MCM subunit Mcm2 (Cdc46/Mcm family)